MSDCPSGTGVFAVDLLPNRLIDVTFRYDHVILESLSHNFEQGELYAFVGPGKSTFMRLMGQVLVPDQGFLGIPPHLRVLHIDRTVSILDASLYRNVVLGDEEAEKASQPRLLRICEHCAFSHRMISAMRSGRDAEPVRREARQEEAAALSAQCGGMGPDLDFHRMIRVSRQQCPLSAAGIEPLDIGDPTRGIFVCVRKRPIQQHELANRELDCVTTCNPYAIVHERKFKVDGITKCLESHQFQFDRVFDEEVSTAQVYSSITNPIVPWVIENGGRVTLFAYGQTGSGKTFTMTGIQRQLSEQCLTC